MKSIVLFVFMVLIFSSSLNAEEKISYQGYLELNNYYYFEQDESYVPEAVLSFKLKILLSEKCQFKTELKARYNYLELEKGVFLEDSEYRPFLSVEESYLTYSWQKADFYAGIRKINWGITDRFNPIDLINPVDSTDLINDRKIGLPLVAVNYYLGDFRLETVVAPYFIPNRLPPAESYFFFGSDLPEEKELPAFSLENVQAGILLAWEYENLELTGMGYHGYDHLPFVELQFLSPIAMQVNYSYEKMMAFGGGFEFAIQQVVLRGEGAHYHYPNLVNQDYTQYVVGLDYSFGQIVDTYNLYLTLQYIGETPTVEDIFWVRHLLTDAGSVKVIFGNEFLEAGLESVYNFPNSGLILIPSVNYNFKNNISLHGEYNYFSGEKESFWEYNQKNQRLIFTVKYSF